MAHSIKFNVVGERKIFCVSCETLIRLMLERISGVLQVTSSARMQHIAVHSDGTQATADQVQTKLHEMGFAVEQIALKESSS